MTCLCGNRIEPVLASLGSPWCQDCRDYPERKRRTLSIHRALVEVERLWIEGPREKTAA